MRMRMGIRWRRAAGTFLGAALVLLAAPSATRAAMMIQPSLIETRLDAGTYASTLIVTSSDTTAQRYRINVEHFVFNDKGTVRTVPPDEHSLVSWIKLNPKEFELAPKETRMIRIAVVPPAQVKPGEYWAALEFEPLQGQMAEAERDGRTVRLQIISSILIPVIGQIGQMKYGADVRDLTAWKTEKGVEVRARLGNDGNGRLRMKGTYELIGGDGAVASEGILGDGTILVGQERVFGQRLEGSYPDGCSVRVKFGSDKLAEVLTGEAPVDATPPSGAQPAGPTQSDPGGKTEKIGQPGAGPPTEPIQPFGSGAPSLSTGNSAAAALRDEAQTPAPTKATLPR
jgi:hypothetical protein